MFQKAIYGLAVVLGSSYMLPKHGFAQLKEYTFDQIATYQKKEPRNLAVFIHADWCTYCHTMQHTTFKNQHVIQLLNKEFYFIRLDAEEKKNIAFNGHTFRYKSTGDHTGANELAEALGKNEDGQLPSPSLVFLNPKNEILFQYGGFLNGPDFIKLWKKVMEAK